MSAPESRPSGRSLALCFAPLHIFSAVILLLYLAPVITLSGRPVQPAAYVSIPELTAQAATDTQVLDRLAARGIDSVLLREDRLRDIEDRGAVHVASGEEILRLYKLQSLVTFYIYEQIRDKGIEPQNAYLFMSDAAVFERVYNKLRENLADGDVEIYDRLHFRGDASIPDNFVLESNVPPDVIRDVPMGFDPSAVFQVGGMVETGRGRLHLFLHSFSGAIPVGLSDVGWTVMSGARGDTAIPAFLFTEPYQVIHPAASWRDVGAAPAPAVSLTGLDLGPHWIWLAAVSIWIFAGTAAGSIWNRWAPALIAAWVVLYLSFWPDHPGWVRYGQAFLLPSCAMLVWLACANAFRRAQNGRFMLPAVQLRFAGLLLINLGFAGAVLSAFLWESSGEFIRRVALWGVVTGPALALIAFFTVWVIEKAGRPLYPLHFRTVVEILLTAAVLWYDAPVLVVVLFAGFVWMRWLILLDRTHGQPLENAPGNYLVFWLASALAMRPFIGHPAHWAALAAIAGYALGAAGACWWLWLTRRLAPRPN